MQDPASWQAFGTDMLGMMAVPGNGAEGHCFLKMDEAPHRIIIEPASDDRFACGGWEVADANALAAVAKQLEAAGCTVTPGTAEESDVRAVTAFVHTNDPAGNRLEVFHGRASDATPFTSATDVNRFVTEGIGLGHIVVPAPNMDETHDFYASVLGFGDSDDLNLPAPAEGVPPMRIRFMHADNPRHHSLALFNFPAENGLVHMMVEVDELDTVGKALDRINAAGIPLMSSLGRHCNDNMLSFYVIGPGGIIVEYGWDGLQLDWDNFEPTVSTEGDTWGHHYNMPSE
jgi:3,4-dihydroxy-9,10-secoandrosta-1,3,5(10)-triene-9,17-dione 4,5-dioxygenase